jgi:prophage maintenance system killer protein
MSKGRITVQELANEANIEVDEVLIALWDADPGYNNILQATDRLKKPNRARRILGLATRRELRSIAYWMSVFDLYEPELHSLLQKLSVSISKNAQLLPHKAIPRLKAHARKHGIDPITGKTALSQVKRKTSGDSDFAWRIVGHPRDLRYLDKDEVLAIHFELVNDFLGTDNPIEPPGPRSDHLLASSVFRPHTASRGELKYPTVEMSAAALLHSIIHDHPFHNGNKRTALVSALVFLDENGFFPEFDENQAFKLVLDVAQHRITDFHSDNLPDREVLAITDWFHKNCRILEKGDHPIPFRKLRQILRGYKCNFDVTGNKVNITRSVYEPPSLMRTLREPLSFMGRHRTLHAQFAYHGEGSEVTQATLKKIRKDLQIDDDHGIDSRAFYVKEPIKVTDFVNRYRKTLTRLAKF